MFAGHLALVIAALFTGAAFFVSFAEQPARLGLDDRALLAEWQHSYKRGSVIQAPLAVVGPILGIVAWWLTGRVAFVVGAILLFANVPWTLVGILPTNKALMETKLEEAGPQSRELIVKWSRLHLVRTILGGLAIVAFVIASGTD
jgi:hypothetical protein